MSDNLTFNWASTIPCLQIRTTYGEVKMVVYSAVRLSLLNPWTYRVWYRFVLPLQMPSRRANENSSIASAAYNELRMPVASSAGE
jgi:hypothetical protein